MERDPLLITSLLASTENKFRITILCEQLCEFAIAVNMGHCNYQFGVTFDNNFKHISQTCRCCFYQIRDLRRIRWYMSLSVAKTTATALTSSRLDYSIPSFIILQSRILQNFNVSKIVWLG